MIQEGGGIMVGEEQRVIGEQLVGSSVRSGEVTGCGEKGKGAAPQVLGHRVEAAAPTEPVISCAISPGKQSA